MSGCIKLHKDTTKKQVFELHLRGESDLLAYFHVVQKSWATHRMVTLEIFSYHNLPLYQIRIDDWRQQKKKSLTYCCKLHKCLQMSSHSCSCQLSLRIVWSICKQISSSLVVSKDVSNLDSWWTSELNQGPLLIESSKSNFGRLGSQRINIL